MYSPFTPAAEIVIRDSLAKGAGKPPRSLHQRGGRPRGYLSLDVLHGQKRRKASESAAYCRPLSMLLSVEC